MAVIPEEQVSNSYRLLRFWAVPSHRFTTRIASLGINALTISFVFLESNFKICDNSFWASGERAIPSTLILTLPNPL
uniref:Uncharacterized protein n=1 Tax=Providencia alcalifaciens TaxID=126385 RepID=H7C8H6_9GAMM|nr:hypothetical protein [Providencia alcalifaciens]